MAGPGAEGGEGASREALPHAGGPRWAGGIGQGPPGPPVTFFSSRSTGAAIFHPPGACAGEEGGREEMDGEEEGRGEGWRRAGKDKAGEGSGAVFRVSNRASDQLGWCRAAARLRGSAGKA